MSIKKGSLCYLKDCHHTFDGLTVPVRWPIWSMNELKIVDYLTSQDVFVVLDIRTMPSFEHNYTVIVLTPKGDVGTMGVAKDELFLVNNKTKRLKHHGNKMQNRNSKHR
jgi:hypothetical protein